MKFVYIVARSLVGSAVDGHAVPHLILYDKHPDFLELLPKLFDVVTDHAVVQLHVGTMIEHVEGACHIQFQRGCHVFRLRFCHPAQLVVQISQNRHLFRHGVCEVFPIHVLHSAVDQALFLCAQSVAPAYNQLAQRQNEVGLECQRFVLVGVIEIDVHRVDVIIAGGRNADDLSL